MEIAIDGDNLDFFGPARDYPPPDTPLWLVVLLHRKGLPSMSIMSFIRHFQEWQMVKQY